jgi:hypothetical protein
MILFLMSGIILLVFLLLVLLGLHFVYHDMVDGLLHNILVQGPVGILGGLSILSFLEAYGTRVKR